MILTQCAFSVWAQFMCVHNAHDCKCEILYKNKQTTKASLSFSSMWLNLWTEWLKKKVHERNAKLDKYLHRTLQIITFNVVIHWIPYHLRAVHLPSHIRRAQQTQGEPARIYCSITRCKRPQTSSHNRASQSVSTCSFVCMCVCVSCPWLSCPQPDGALLLIPIFQLEISRAWQAAAKA